MISVYATASKTCIIRRIVKKHRANASQSVQESVDAAQTDGEAVVQISKTGKTKVCDILYNIVAKGNKYYKIFSKTAEALTCII